MKDVDRLVASLAERQHGAFTRAQVRSAGLTPSAISKRITAGSFVAVTPAVLRLPGQQLTWFGRLSAGLLDLGEGALVSGAAAAQLLSLDGFVDDAVEFLVPRAVRARRSVGEVSSTSDLVPLDRTIISGFPCTSATRTVIELLRTSRPDTAARALDSACRQRLTAHSVVRRRLEELGRRGRSGVALFDELTRVGSVESWLERRFLALLAQLGLPAPVLQQRYRLADVGVARVDFEYPLREIVIEVGGSRGYLSREERQRQERRRNALQLEGKTIYFFTHDDIVGEETYVARTISRALATESTRRSRPDIA